jgi:hypothetical protein
MYYDSYYVHNNLALLLLWPCYNKTNLALERKLMEHSNKARGGMGYRLLIATLRLHPWLH